MTTPRGSFGRYVDQRLDDPRVRAAHDDYEARRALVAELVSRRKRLGLSQSQIAEQMGVKQPTVSGFENEDTDPRLSTLYRYARAVDACISIRLHVKSPDGDWERAGMWRGWRPPATPRSGFAGPSYGDSCQIVHLAAYRRLEPALPRRAANG